jgi:hypothetical protein
VIHAEHTGFSKIKPIAERRQSEEKPGTMMSSILFGCTTILDCAEGGVLLMRYGWRRS